MPSSGAKMYRKAAERLLSLEKKRLKKGILSVAEENEARSLGLYLASMNVPIFGNSATFDDSNSVVSNNQKPNLELSTKAQRQKLNLARFSLFNSLEKSFRPLLIGSLVIIFLIFMLVLAPGRTKSANAYQNEYTSASYYVKLTASESVDMSLETMSNFATTNQRDTLYVTSNMPNYDIYLSTTNESNSLFLNGNSSSDSLVATSAVGDKIVGMTKNSWGYAVSTSGRVTSGTTIDNTDVPNLLYYAVPSSGNETKIISYAKTDASTETTESYDIYYGVKADKTKPSGVYSNSVLYSVISNTTPTGSSATASPDAITDDNPLRELTITTDLMTNMPLSGNDVVITLKGNNTGNTLTCTNNQISMTDNVVIITCDVPTTTTYDVYKISANVTKFGKTYTDFDDVMINSTPNPFNIVYMQQMTTDRCSSVTTPSTTAMTLDTTGAHAGDTSYIPQASLIDTRGNGRGSQREYLIRKLADGNCWMVQYLDLEFDTTLTLTNSDTDLNSKTTWSPGTTSYTGVSNWNNSTAALTYDNGDLYCHGTAASVYQTCDSVMQNDMTEHAGNYYNWYAATAGSGTSSMVSGSETNTNDVADSICPYGWRLPAGARSTKLNNNGKKYTFYNLLDAYGLASTSKNVSASNLVKLRSVPFSMPLSGSHDTDRSSFHGQYNYEWTSSASNTSGGSEGFGFNYGHDTRLETVYTRPKYRGFGIRCVAR